MTARPGPSLEVSQPVEAPEFQDRVPRFPVASVSRDGRRVLMIQPEGTTTEPALIVLTNWEVSWEREPGWELGPQTFGLMQRTAS